MILEPLRGCRRVIKSTLLVAIIIINLHSTLIINNANYNSSLNQIIKRIVPEVHVHAWNLSDLFSSFTWDSNGNDEEETEEAFRRRINYPHRDLLEEFGEEVYHNLIKDSLGDPTINIQSLMESSYGVDISYPIHHSLDNLKDNDDSNRLQNAKSFYKSLIQGCKNFYKENANACDMHEQDRINMNLRQPPTMQNYTHFGFKKVKAPREITRLLHNFWNNNKNRRFDMRSMERWTPGNTFTNHWTSPTHMLPIDNPHLEGGGYDLKNKIWNAARNILSEWTGEDDLVPASLYGIRVYESGSTLAPHVDRLPLVISAIINVAQDVEEDWPLEVYAHDGKAYNLTMRPGDMILYESHSIVHGRPFPLKGNYYANVFIHFEPRGHSMRHSARLDGSTGKDNGVEKAKELYEKAQKSQIVRKHNKDDLPHHIVPGSHEEERWKQKEKYTILAEKITTHASGTTRAHIAASDGNLELMRKVIRTNKDSIYAKDSNGWQAIHENVREGNLEIFELLVKNGVDINARTNNDRGGTPLWWAKKTHGEDHPITKRLRELGADDSSPEL